MTPHTSFALLWFLTTLVPCLWATQSQYCRTSDYHRPRGFCGNNLAEILKIICTGRGFMQPGRKRSDMMPLPEDTVIMDPESRTMAEIPEDGPFLVKAKAMSLLNKRDSVVISGVTYRRGVTCECCVHKCSYSEFEQYCLPLIRKRTTSGGLSRGGALYRFVNKPLQI